MVCTIMRSRSFKRKKRLGMVQEDENEPEEEASPYTSQSLRLATVQSGAYVAWGSLATTDSTAGRHIWELRERYSSDTSQFEEPPPDDDEDDDDDDELDNTYDDEVLKLMRKQLKAERKSKITLQDLMRYKMKQDKLAWETTSYKLTSLQGRGEAELIRFLFVYAEEHYEDERITQEQWDELKPTTVYNSLPIISKCGKQWGNTGAIVRVLARKFLLMGVTNDENLVVEATYERLRRLKRNNSLAIDWVITGEKNKEKMEWAQSQLLHVILPPAIKEWEMLICKTPGPFIVASGVTVADLAIMDFLDQCSSHLLIDSLLSDYLAVSDLILIIRRFPRILAYLDERPET